MKFILLVFVKSSAQIYLLISLAHLNYFAVMVKTVISSKFEGERNDLLENIDRKSRYYDVPKGKYVTIYNKFLLYKDPGVYSFFLEDFCKPFFRKYRSGKHGERYMVRINSKETYLDFLMAVVFVDNDSPETKTFIWHIDGDFSNDNPSNLRWVTPEEFRDLRQTIKTETPPEIEFDPDSVPEGVYERMTGKSINYLLYDEGGIYSLHIERMLKHNNRNGRNHQSNVNVNGFIDNFVATAFVYNDDPVNKTEIWHIDGDLANDDKSNLMWVTPQEHLDFETERFIKEYLKDKPPTLKYREYPENTNYISFNDCSVLSKFTRKFIYVPGKGKLNRYHRINLQKDGKTVKVRVHRITAVTWIPNYRNKSEFNQVDHINRMKHENDEANLRWVNSAENRANRSHNRTRNRTVRQYDLEGNLVRTFESRKEAMKLAKLPSRSGCLHNKHLVSRVDGLEYLWIYENFVEPFDRPDNFTPIPGYPNNAVSKDGLLYSERERNFMKPSPSEEGYLRVHLIDENGTRRQWTVGELVLMTYQGPKPEKEMEVNHKNGFVDDNRLENLEFTSKTVQAKHKSAVLGKGVTRVVCYDKVDDVVINFPSATNCREKLGCSEHSMKKYVKDGDEWYKGRYQFFVHPINYELNYNPDAEYK